MKIQEIHPADRSRHVVQENESGRLGWLGHLVGEESRGVMKLQLAGNPAGKRRQDIPQTWWLDDGENECP
jgi:hypothetical protein